MSRDSELRLKDGRTIGWREFGAADGRPVLAFHGAPASRLMYEPAARSAQARGLRLIAPDRPGYGLSSPHPDRTLATFADDVRAVLDHLAIDTAPILAISGGCPYAVVTSVALGPRISALALVSPLGEIASPAAGRILSWPQRAFFRRLPRRPALLRRLAAAARMGFMLSPEASHTVFKAGLTPPDRAVLATAEARAVVIAMTAEALRSGVDGAVSDLALYARAWPLAPEAVTCPTALWQGTSDAIVPAALAFDLATRIPGCLSHELPGQGHFWVLEHIDEVLAELARLAGYG
jgi:pimeloyl-ACP methyl ester carboxylesterase